MIEPHFRTAVRLRSSAGPTPNVLLSPVRIGTRQVRNRLVLTAHGFSFEWAHPASDGERYREYLRRRAAGGTGLIITQSAGVVPAPSERWGRAYGHLPERLGRIADAVHQHGTTLLMQIGMVGAQFRSNAHPALTPLWSMSGGTSPEGEPSHAMTASEIESVLDGFAGLASVAVASGFDGVELHGAHGYLLQQSMSPWGNQRTDRWGEPTAFGDELISRVRAVIGTEAILGLRMSIEDWRAPEEGGLGHEGLLRLASHFAASGAIDYLGHSEGSRSAHYTRSIGNWRVPHCAFLPLTANLKAANPDLPVIGVGRIVSTDQAHAAIENGTCDLVGMTRALIADPDIGNKLRDGATERIRPCVGATQGCVDRILLNLPITCFHNPEVGRAGLLDEGSAASPKRVLVVGGGPAGLKAAEVAARRGHHVTLVDRGAALGGRLLSIDQLDGLAEVVGSVRFLAAELEALDVELVLGRTVDGDELAVRRPDVVVLATGATPDVSRLPAGPDGDLPVLSVDERWSARSTSMSACSSSISSARSKPRRSRSGSPWPVPASCSAHRSTRSGSISVRSTSRATSNRSPSSVCRSSPTRRSFESRAAALCCTRA
jgi:2,4-dienoyl-CoA reductase-like NADH-dependent reductase (Old Yellow Enzyme family)